MCDVQKPTRSNTADHQMHVDGVGVGWGGGGVTVCSAEGAQQQRQAH